MEGMMKRQKFILRSRIGTSIPYLTKRLLFLIVISFIFSCILLSNRACREDKCRSTRLFLYPVIYIMNCQIAQRSSSANSLSRLNFSAEKRTDGPTTLSSRVVAPLPAMLTSPYLLNNGNICRQTRNLVYIILVYTVFSHFERRQRIRDTWGNRFLFPRGRVVFLIGTTKSNRMQSTINIEFEKYKDIVQGNFHDTYHNLTYKGVMGLGWVTEFCSEVKVVLKIDDDVVLNMYLFLRQYLPQLTTTQLTMMGHIRSNSPVARKKKSKWFVPNDNYWFRNDTVYPTYANGLWVGINMEMVKTMYEKAKHTPFFWVDDVYLFGILLKDVNVTYINIRNAITYKIQMAKMCFRWSSSRSCDGGLLQCNRTSRKCNILVVHGQDTNNMVWHMITEAESRKTLL